MKKLQEMMKDEFLKTYNCKTMKQFHFRYVSTDKFVEIMDNYFLKCSYNQKYKQALNEINNYCKEESEYWGVDDYICGLNKGCDTTKKDILQIIDKVGD